MTEQLTAEVQQRLHSEANIWLATVRLDSRPHLVPVWFAWYEAKIYVCIQGNSIKAKNIEQNPRVALSLEDGSKVVICEGQASVVAPPWPADLAAIFQQKYAWNIYTDEEYDRLLEVMPQKWLIW